MKKNNNGNRNRKIEKYAILPAIVIAIYLFTTTSLILIEGQHAEQISTLALYVKGMGLIEKEKQPIFQNAFEQIKPTNEKLINKIYSLQKTIDLFTLSKKYCTPEKYEDCGLMTKEIQTKIQTYQKELPYTNKNIKIITLAEHIRKILTLIFIALTLTALIKLKKRKIKKKNEKNTRNTRQKK